MGNSRSRQRARAAATAGATEGGDGSNSNRSRRGRRGRSRIMRSDRRVSQVAEDSNGGRMDLDRLVHLLYLRQELEQRQEELRNGGRGEQQGTAAGGGGGQQQQQEGGTDDQDGGGEDSPWANSLFRRFLQHHIVMGTKCGRDLVIDQQTILTLLAT